MRRRRASGRPETRKPEARELKRAPTKPTAKNSESTRRARETSNLLVRPRNLLPARTRDMGACRLRKYYNRRSITFSASVRPQFSSVQPQFGSSVSSASIRLHFGFQLQFGLSSASVRLPAPVRLQFGLEHFAVDRGRGGHGGVAALSYSSLGALILERDQKRKKY